MDRDKKEKELIFQWACNRNSPELKEKIFPSIDLKCDSYFLKREHSGNYLCEYNFQELPQLKVELQKIWEKDEYMEEIITVILAGAFKNRIEALEETEGGSEFIEELPQYIYNF